MAEKKLRITLVKSPIGAVPKNKKTVEAFRDVVTKEIGTAFDEFGKAVRNAKV